MYQCVTYVTSNQIHRIICCLSIHWTEPQNKSTYLSDQLPHLLTSLDHDQLHILLLVVLLQKPVDGLRRAA